MLFTFSGILIKEPLNRLFYLKYCELERAEVVDVINEDGWKESSDLMVYFKDGTERKLFDGYIRKNFFADYVNESVKSESAILDDVGFIDAASWQMAGLYADYLRSTETAPEGPSAPQTPEPPPPVQAAEGQKIYLLLSSRSGEDTRRAMELLGDAQGTFLLTLEQMEDGDQIGRAHV